MSAMMTPTRVSDLIVRTAQPTDIDERPGLAILHADLSNAEVRGAWLDLRRSPPPFIASIVITNVESDEQLEDDTPASDARFRIVVETASAEEELRLFLGNSLLKAVDAIEHVNCVQIADMGGNGTFTTYRSRFQVWTNEPPEPYAPSETLPDPRTLSNDFTRVRLVPEDLRPWLQRGGPKKSSTAYEAWKRLSGPRLLAALANRVSETDAGIAYHFSGPPSCIITPSPTQLHTIFDRMMAGAVWVFTEGRDTDTRHLLLANELARSHRKSSFDDIGDGSLDSAKGAYAAYVKSSSRETLKALAELRKTVSDEAQKASQKAQDLASSLWKDAALAAVPFGLKLLPDAAKVGNRYLAGAMAIAAILLVASSYGTQLFINHKFFKNQQDARRIWKQALNTVLTPAEIEEFSEKPITKSIADYRTVRCWVGFVYSGLIITLAVFAIYNFWPDLFGTLAPAAPRVPAP